MGPLAEGPHPPAIAPLVFTYPMPGAEAQRGNYNARMERWQLDVVSDDLGNADVNHHPEFTLTQAEIPPTPPARINLNDGSPPTTPEEWIRIMIDKTDSRTGSEIYMARQELIKAAQAKPTPSLTRLHAEFQQYMRYNPKSGNHMLQDLHTAHAQGQGGSAFARGNHPRQGSAHNAQHGDPYAYQPSSDMMYEGPMAQSYSMSHSSQGSGSASANASMGQEQGYGAQIRQMGQASAAALTRAEIDGMTNDQLGKRYREESMQGQSRGYPCHYWGYINGQLACGAEMALGVCNYRNFHFSDHVGPPAKTFDRTRSSAPVPGLPGQSLRPSGSM
jgi:hypothetical protein